MLKGTKCSYRTRVIWSRQLSLLHAQHSLVGHLGNPLRDNWVDHVLCSVNVHPGEPTTLGTMRGVMRTRRFAFRLWSFQVLLGRLLISTKALCMMHSSIGVAIALAVILTAENDICENIRKIQIEVYLYLLLW